VTVNAGMPWAVRLPKPEPRPQASPAGAADAESATESAASPGSRHRRRKGPERPASPQPSPEAAPTSGSPEGAASDERSQRGQAAKMPIAAKEWEYSAGPEDVSSGREERRKAAAAAAAEGAGGAAKDAKEGDETPAYGPWIGKTKVSGVRTLPASSRMFTLESGCPVHAG